MRNLTKRTRSALEGGHRADPQKIRKHRDTDRSVSRSSKELKRDSKRRNQCHKKLIQNRLKYVLIHCLIVLLKTVTLRELCGVEGYKVFDHSDLRQSGATGQPPDSVVSGTYHTHEQRGEDQTLPRHRIDGETKGDAEEREVVQLTQKSTKITKKSH